eukprot:GHUV01027363.1.p1 GENE.GHUV01027363.1~~GHUV01027363.1.p1  ORF type:complete len:215 (-),score=65.89 GHUV01027363.1:7-651(-)
MPSTCLCATRCITAMWTGATSWRAIMLQGHLRWICACGPCCFRDGGFSAGISLRGITPLPDMVEGSSSANADSPRELLLQSGPSTPPAQSSVILSVDEEAEIGDEVEAASTAGGAADASQLGRDSGSLNGRNGSMDGSAGGAPQPSVTWRHSARQLQTAGVGVGSGSGRSQQQHVQQPGELSLKGVANDIVPLKSKISREWAKQPEHQEAKTQG